jgi:hypothetical protein
MGRRNEKAKAAFEAEFWLVVRSLWDYIEMGREARRLAPRYSRKKFPVQLIPSTCSITPNSWRKSTTVAGVISNKPAMWQDSFTDGELDGFIRRCREARLFPAREQLCDLASIKDREKRERWIDKLILNRWSVRNLQAELLHSRGKLSNGGRKPSPATTRPQVKHRNREAFKTALFCDDLLRPGAADVTGMACLGDAAFRCEVADLKKALIAVVSRIDSDLNGDDTAA